MSEGTDAMRTVPLPLPVLVVRLRAARILGLEDVREQVMEDIDRQLDVILRARMSAPAAGPRVPSR